MNNEQIRMVKESFEQLTPLADEIGALFYHHLFLRDPKLESLFSNTNPDDQVMQFTLALSYIVRNLEQSESIKLILAELSQRHVRYGVMPEHYDVVGEALLDALRAALKQRFDLMTEQSWAEAYKLVAREMKHAAYGDMQCA